MLTPKRNETDLCAVCGMGVRYRAESGWFHLVLGVGRGHDAAPTRFAAASARPTVTVDAPAAGVAALASIMATALPPTHPAHPTFQESR